MPILRDLDELPSAARGGAVSVGNFDGVHRGHERIIRRLLQRADQLSAQAVVFTFDPHPVRLLRPDQCPPPLTWTRRKVDLLARLGVQIVVAYPTDEALLQLSAEKFFQEIIVDAFHAQAMVEGPNFFFGRDREGDVERLARLTAQHEISLDVVDPLVVGGDLVSSSRIRRLIAAGEVAAASQLLTASYRIRGMVTHGAGRGKKLGFPTANLEAVDTLLPQLGVYAGRAYVNNEACDAAIHIGPNPTFGEHGVKVEVHLIGRQAELYGQPLEVEFVSRLRDVGRFASQEELLRQLSVDVGQAREQLSDEADRQHRYSQQEETSR